MSETTWIPIRLFPEAYLKFKSCSLLPGVSLAPLEGDIKRIITDMDRGCDVLARLNADFSPKHVIRVNDDDYLSGLANRLKKEQQALPEQVFVEHHSIAKQTAMALLLTGPIHFETATGAYGTNKRDGKLVCSGWSRIALVGRTASNEAYPICHVSTKQIKAEALRSMMLKLDRYFRSGMWWTDRLGMTLEYFWNGVCTSHSEQAFLSLTTAMESLLTTQSMEITHNLAERVAVLLASTCDSRLDRYRQIKKLYSTRSKIVHGKVFPKRGRIDSGTLFVGPKWSHVPTDDLKLIIETTLTLIRAIFRRPALLSIIQKKQSEDKTNQKLDEYFLKQLFK